MYSLPTFFRTFPNYETSKSENHGVQTLTNKDNSRLQSQIPSFKQGILPTEELHVTEENPEAKEENSRMMSIIGCADKSENSIELITVEQELQRINKESSAHGITVFGIANSAKSEQEAIQMLRESLQGFLSTKTCGGKTCINTHKIIKGVVEGTDKLLASIHESFLCQSETLKASYDKLNKHINKTLSFIHSKCTIEDISHRNGINDNNLDNTANTEIKESTIPPTEKNELLKDTSEDSKLQKKVQELEQQLRDRRMEFDCLKIEKDQESSDMKESTSKLQKELDTYKQKEADMQSQLVTLKSENENLRVTNDRLTRLEKLTDQVQLQYEAKGELISKAIDELKSRLVQHMGKQRRELKLIHCPKVDDVDPDIPLIVICINVSRIGTDVQRTLHHLNASNRVALLILHHKDVHALPSQASERVLTGVDFQSLGGIFDLAFLAEKGLYQCDMNSKAVEGIVNFIKTK